MSTLQHYLKERLESVDAKSTDITIGKVFLMALNARREPQVNWVEGLDRVQVVSTRGQSDY